MGSPPLMENTQIKAAFSFVRRPLAGHGQITQVGPRYLIEQAPLKDPLDRMVDDREDVEVLPVDGVYHGYSQAPTVGLDGQQQGLQPSWANLGRSEITLPPFL